MKEACGRRSRRHHRRHRHRGRRVAAAVPVPVSERSQVHIRRGSHERRAFAGERSLRVESAARVPRVLLSLSLSRVRAFILLTSSATTAHAARYDRPKFTSGFPILFRKIWKSSGIHVPI